MVHIGIKTSVSIQHQTYLLVLALDTDEYSIISHRQDNVKLEYNREFRAQLCMLTGTRGVKLTLSYKQRKLFYG